MDVDESGLTELYLRYLALCNEHRFTDLGRYVATDVGGGVTGLSDYVEGLQAVVAAFPDYRWEPLQLVTDGEQLAARLVATGTHAGPFRGIPATGRVLRTQELAVYRWRDGKIVECWGDLGSTVRDALVPGNEEDR